MPRWVCAIIIVICSHTVLCQKKERAFDPFVPRQAAEKLADIEHVQIKSNGLARLASLIWKYDENYARTLFEKALAVSHPQNNKSDGRLKLIHRQVIAVIAAKDPQWAKRLIDSSVTFDDQGQHSANMNTALSLVDSAPGNAVEFARRALRDRLPPQFLQFLLTLRTVDALVFGCGIAQGGSRKGSRTQLPRRPEGIQEQWLGAVWTDAKLARATKVFRGAESGTEVSKRLEECRRHFESFSLLNRFLSPDNSESATYFRAVRIKQLGRAQLSFNTAAE